MDPSPTVTDEIFTAFLKCRYKGYLKLRRHPGEKSDYERLQDRLATEYRAAATRELLRQQGVAGVIESPTSLPDVIRVGADLIINATASDAGDSCHLDALQKMTGRGAGIRGCYTPVLFVRREKVTADDRLLLAFGASVLARVQGASPAVGRIIHGRQFRASRVELTRLSETVREKIGEIRAVQDSGKAPPLILNRHCPECEFRQHCRAAAIEKDDLSLLGGLSPKEIVGLNARGIFTVTQYSFTFRPGRMKRAAKEAGGKHDHSLQALAIREKTVYVARRPQLPAGNVRVYLDVEGLPDEDFYYLIGLTISADGGQRRLSFWADGRAEEATIWASFLQAVGELGEDLFLFHYGSYESHFFERMEARHGGDPALIARVKSRSVNVLSLIYSRVYFPAYANDLKSVASSLGFCWSSPEASGLQSIVWRCRREATGDESLKQQLLTYNQEDCLALEKVVEILRSLGAADRQPEDGDGPRVSEVEGLEAPHRRQFGKRHFALPEFARITKCAYFDYQRNKVLCRSSPTKKSLRSKKVRRRRTGRVNLEVECGVPTVCQNCGSRVFDLHSRYRKLVIDLKPFGGGLKRWVTAYNVRRYRCRDCQNTQTPEDYQALASQKYGRGLCSWIVYALISQRQTNEAVVETLHEQFQIGISDSSVANLRRRSVEYYRPCYEALLSTLRGGRWVHADETRVRIKGTRPRAET